MTAVLPCPLESVSPTVKDLKADKLSIGGISRRPRRSSRASPAAITSAFMCPPTFVQQTPGIPGPSAAGALQYSLLSLPLVQPANGSAPMQPANGPAGCSIFAVTQQQAQQLRQQQQQQQPGGGQGAKLGGNGPGREAGAAALPQLDPASWLSLGAAPVAHPAALLGGGAQPFAGLAPPAPLQGLPQASGPALELQMQLEAVKAQVASQQQFIRSLHKWAGSTAAAVRQVQDQWRSSKEGMKVCENEVVGLKSQLSQLSKELEGKDSKIEGLVQELSDVKAQLVEVERMVSELGPHIKRRRLHAHATGSMSDPTPGAALQQPLVGAEDLLGAELPDACGAASRVVVREGEGASFSTDRPHLHNDDE